jgi:hypothetical protein
MQRLRLSLLLLSMALPAAAMAGASGDAICESLAKRIRQLQSESPPVDIDSIDGKELCFEACQPGQVSAQSLIASASPEESQDLQKELENSRNWIASVSRIDINGDGRLDVQISRRVGSAVCVRNTYLVSSEKGLRLLKSDAFASLSEEAGNCGAGAVRPEHLDGSAYIVKAFYGELTAFLVSKEFDLGLVCTIQFPWSPDDPSVNVPR